MKEYYAEKKAENPDLAPESCLSPVVMRDPTLTIGEESGGCKYFDIHEFKLHGSTVWS